MKRDMKLESLIRIAERKLIKRIDQTAKKKQFEEYQFYTEILIKLDQIKETYHNITGQHLQKQENDGFDYKQWGYKLK